MKVLVRGFVWWTNDFSFNINRRSMHYLDSNWFARFSHQYMEFENYTFSKLIKLFDLKPSE